MEKPISLKIKEFEIMMVNLINASGLPSIIIEPILKNISNEIHAINDQQYLQDKTNYEKSLVEETKKQEENNSKEGENQNG